MRALPRRFSRPCRCGRFRISGIPPPGRFQAAAGPGLRNPCRKPSCRGIAASARTPSMSARAVFSRSFPPSAAKSRIAYRRRSARAEDIQRSGLRQSANRRFSRRLELEPRFLEPGLFGSGRAEFFEHPDGFLRAVQIADKDVSTAVSSPPGRRRRPFRSHAGVPRVQQFSRRERPQG